MKSLTYMPMIFALLCCAGCKKTESASDYPSKGYGWSVDKDLSGRSVAQLVAILGKPTETNSYDGAIKPSFSGTPYPAKFDKQLVYRRSSNMGHTLIYVLDDYAILVVTEHSDF